MARGLSILEFVLYGLATWRLSAMFTREEGPGMVFTKVRYRTGAESDMGFSNWETMDSLGKLSSCPLCLSVWVSALLLVIKFVNGRFYRYLILVLAGSALSNLLEEITRNDF